jgi:small-conductance mechanosensitive channel
MKSRFTPRSHVLFAGLLLAAGHAVHGQQTIAAPTYAQGAAAETNSQQNLISEIRKLRIQLLELCIEKQAEAVAALERDRTTIAAERQNLANSEHMVQEQSTSLDTSLKAQPLTPEQQADVDRMKETFTAGLTEELNKKRASLQTREAENSAALQVGQQHLDALRTKLKNVAVAE